jgi:chromate transporter
VGVVLNLSIWFALHTMFGTVAEERVGAMRLLVPDWSTVDVAAVLIAVAASVAMLRYHIGIIATLSTSAGVGLLLHLAPWR